MTAAGTSPRAAAGGFALAANLFVAAPLLARMPWWGGVIFGLFLLWHGLHELRGFAPPSRPVRHAVFAASLAGVLVFYGSLVRWDALLALLTLLLACYFMAPARPRERLVVALIGAFLVLGNLVASGIAVLPIAHMFCAAVLIAAQLMRNVLPEASPGFLLRRSAVLFLQALPFLLVMLVVFPRLGRFLGRTREVAAGFSDTVNPRGIVSLAANGAVAFRAEFPQGAPPVSGMYWRGATLWDTDGWGWKNEGEVPREELAPEVWIKTYPHSVRLVPYRGRALFALDLPLSVILLDTDEYESEAGAPYEFRADRRIYDSLSYRAISARQTAWPLSDAVTGGAPPLLDAEVRRRALALPPGISPEARELAASFRAAGDTGEVAVAKALRHFGTGGFSYTLAPGTGGDALEQFLFRDKRGFCGHFASAFAVLLRLAGVPARVVAGYQGGTYNELGGYWLVRQQHAHAWAEAWIEGRGWVRVDPTAVVMPGRIEEGRTLQSFAEDSSFARAFADFWLLLDGAGYGLDNLFALQRRWFAAAAVANPLAALAGEYGFYAGAGLAVSLLALGFYFFLSRRGGARGGAGRKADAAGKVYASLCARFARLGYARLPAEGPLSYAARLKRERPDWAPFLDEVFPLYAVLRYGAAPTEAQFRKFRERAKRISTKDCPDTRCGTGSTR